MTMTFEPIAIVGQGCVLPGALSPAELWGAIVRGEDLTSHAPEGSWLVSPEDALTEKTSPAEAIDRAWSDRGGHVRGFAAQFDPSGFQVDAETIAALDPLFQWTLHAGREALRDAGMSVGDAHHARVGAVLGNLSYPTQALARFAESVWAQDDQRPHLLNRFMSGMPAHLTAQALGLGGRAFALDAACASSLYAMKVACDLLHDREVDVMLAGGANHADDLFLHVGFAALSALSKTGQSRPFHAQADGLLPAAGAGYLVLKRLDDALSAGDRVLAVIRGVGLSNDGRGRGLLTPSHDGQVRCMRAAYAVSGLRPEDVSLIECHATGTPLGDGTELGSIAEVFSNAPDLPVGSLKSNMGHLITASGVAGMMKVIGAFDSGMRPASIGAADMPVAMPGDSPLRVLHEAEAWPDRPHRIAGLNNFGFGGNNAHLIMEQFEPTRARGLVSAQRASYPHMDAEIAIIDAAMIAGGAGSADDVLGDTLLHNTHVTHTAGGTARAVADDIELDVAQVRFPPNDLKHTLPQQLLMLQAAFQLRSTIDGLDPARTGSLVGMQCDANVARYGARWRLGEREAVAGATEAERKDAIVPGLVAAGVIGTMPNIVANRLGSQFDLRAPSYTISSEQVSGNVALDVARRALRRGELDAAIVGAVDMSSEPVQEAAAALLGDDAAASGDAACLLVLKRLDDARRDGDSVLAVLAPSTPHDDDAQWHLGDAPGADWRAQDLFGHAHTASGLLNVAVAAQALFQRALPARDGGKPRPWMPGSTPQRARVAVQALGDQAHTIDLVAADPSHHPAPGLLNPILRVYGAASRRELIAAVQEDHPTQAREAGAYRLAIVARDPDDLAARRARALAALERTTIEPGVTSLGSGIWLGHGALDGEVSFVFTGPAGAYPGMGQSLALGMPELLDRLHGRFATIRDAVGWVTDTTRDAGSIDPVDKLWGSSYLCQLHAELTRHILNIPATAAIGFCSGETNALFAMGAWDDLAAMHRDVNASGIFDRSLGGPFEAAQQAWQTDDVQWASWRVRAPIAELQQVLQSEPRAHLTIINAPGDAVIAGDAAACARVIDRIGASRARELGYNLIMHCPEACEFTDAWHALHHRPTNTLPDVRFYTHATLGAYVSDADTCADMLTRQAMSRVDFPALVQRAWEDGVRVFIEHGPHAGCTRWIDRILGDRPHLAIALDEGPSTSLASIAASIARLVCAGVPVDHAAWSERLHPTPPVATSGRRVMKLTFPAHLPSIDPALMGAPRSGVTIMASGHSHDTGANGAQMQRAPALPAKNQALPPTLRPQPQAAAPVAPEALAKPAPKPTPQPVATPAPKQAPSVPAVAVQVTQPAQPALHTIPGDDAFSILAGHAERMAGMHQQFLQQQAALQAQFMQLRAVAEQEFMTALHGVGTLSEQVVYTTPAPVLEAAPVAAPVVPTPQSITPPVAPVAPVAPAAPARPVAPTSARDVAVAPARPAAKPAPVAAKPAPAKKPITVNTPGLPDDAFIDHTGVRVRHTAQPIGPQFDKAQLEIHALGKISDIYGPLFSIQDDFPRQVRMPARKLLLADRVLGIDAEPGKIGKGTLWTESDIHEDDWYLHQGRVPAGIMIESGQADLMLISWMGADFENRGERVYRLLGCDLTYSGGMPRPGDTLRYDIHVDGHARQGDQRLFFFHYDCCIGDDVRLRVRNGQAGFFSDAEMADSGGVLWTPEDVEVDPSWTRDAPRVAVDAIPRSLDRDELVAISEGKIYEVMGDAYFRAAPHTASPTIEGEELMLFDRVTHLEPGGGPWGGGYLRAELDIQSDHWFFDGHFHNDPCMPGTIMYDASLQTMSLYLIAMGYTLEKDGWVFEPVPDETYRLICRGQVAPENKKLVYELFVREVIDGDEPVLWADLLCTVDGLKAFYCENMGYRLTPAWPMDRMPELMRDYVEPKPVAVVDGFEFGYDSLMACGWGKPSRAFGPMYERFDSPIRVARLPGPPYHFLSRVTDVTGPIGVMKTGATCVIEYDVPAGEWYFEQNGCRVMPYAVLLEAALQPCGWLASYIGCALSRDEELFFRNLDGTSTQLVEVVESTGTLRTEVELTSLSRAGSMIIVGFKVGMFVEQTKIYDMTTVFGFFPAEALANQIGLDISPVQRARFDAPSNGVIDLTQRPARYFGELGAGMTLPEPMLLMLDRITRIDNTSGEAGLGVIRGEKDVDPAEWFFKAHFFQDPVQPGSLGIEALLQLLQTFMLHQGIGADVEDGRFEAIAIDKPMTWKYRGQVVPKNKLITSELEITEIGRDERGPFVIAEGSLWVDGKRIYAVKNMGMRVTAGPPSVKQDRDVTGEDKDDPEPAGSGDLDHDATAATEAALTLSAATDPWLLDHCPTYTRPALPMMSVVDLLARFAAHTRPGAVVTAVREVSVRGWIIFDGDTARTFTASVEEAEGDANTLRVTLHVSTDGGPAEVAATGVVTLGDAWGEAPEPFAVLLGTERMADPYASGALFHGPAFHVLREGHAAVGGAYGWLDSDPGAQGVGALNPLLLDGALHVIPHEELSRWDDNLTAGYVAYPHEVKEITLHGPTPAGEDIRVEVRLLDASNPRQPLLGLQLMREDGAVWASIVMTEILLPKGKLGALPGEDRRAFLAERRFVEGAGLSDFDGETTTLAMPDVRASDWFAGTMQQVYQTTREDLPGMTREIAVKEHVSRMVARHPAFISVEEDGTAVADVFPLTRFHHTIEQPHPTRVAVRSSAPARLDIGMLVAYWRDAIGAPPEWLGEDLYGALMERYVRGVVLEDPAQFRALQGRSMLFLGNHEVQIESLLITSIASWLSRTTVITMANAKHEEGWVGTLIRHLFGAPGVTDPHNIVYFNQRDHASMMDHIANFRAEVARRGASIMVHAAGTRLQSVRQPTERLGSLFLDMAIELNLPIVPVRFAGGLPVEPVEGKLEFPVNQGAQDYFLGRAIMPEELAALPYAKRKQRVLDAINGIGPAYELAEPNPADMAHQQAIDAWRAHTGAGEVDATLMCALLGASNPGRDAALLIQGAREGALTLDDTPHGRWLADFARRLYGPNGPAVSLR